MTYILGARSRAELAGVHPTLVGVVERAITITEQDFTVADGMRTLEEQKQNVARGVSKTMNSRHLVQADHTGHAVDLVPWINGKPRWEWPPIYRIAAAMLVSARQLTVPLRWGGVWDKPLLSLDGTGARDIAALPAILEHEVLGYISRHRGPDFLDGPHFELLAA